MPSCFYLIKFMHLVAPSFFDHLIIDLFRRMVITFFHDKHTCVTVDHRSCFRSQKFLLGAVLSFDSENVSPHTICFAQHSRANTLRHA